MAMTIKKVNMMQKLSDVKVKKAPIEKLAMDAGFKAGRLSPNQKKLRKGKTPGKSAIGKG